MSLTDRCIRGSQFIGFYEESQICQFRVGSDKKKKFPSKWNNFTTGNSQLGEGGVSVCVCVRVWLCDFILTRLEWQTHRTVRGLTESAAFDASRGIHEINNRQRKSREIELRLAGLLSVCLCVCLCVCVLCGHCWKGVVAALVCLQQEETGASLNLLDWVDTDSFLTVLPLSLLLLSTFPFAVHKPEHVL